MLVCIYAIWVGALVGMLLKLASPHRNPVSWLFAGLVGGLGGVGGLFVARMFGLSEARWIACYLSVAISAAGIVMLWAVASRAMHRAQVRKGRPTRPTIVF